MLFTYLRRELRRRMRRAVFIALGARLRPAAALARVE